MRQMKQRIFAGLLLAALLLGLVPVTLAADSETSYKIQVNGITYEVFSDHAEVAWGRDDGLTTELILPETVDGVPLTAIQGRAFRQWSMEQVYLPDSITCIGPEAFSGCTNLAYVRMSENLVELGAWVFDQCDSLIFLYLPASFQRCWEPTIGDNTYFGDCVLAGYPGTPAEQYARRFSYWFLPLEGEGELHFTGDGIYRTTDGKTATCYKVVCALNNNFVIPDTVDGLPVTTIGPDVVFQSRYVSSTRSMVLGNNVTTIEAGAFSSPVGQLYIPESVTYISDEAFPYSGCTEFYGVTGSYAETYAREHGFMFYDLARLPFADVPENAWYYDSVYYTFWSGLMKGVSKTSFAPNATTSRAMMIQVLYNISGEDNFTWEYGFTDVPYGAWYTQAVNWGRYYGIVKGVTATEFAPNDPVTREQAATILYRFAEKAGLDTSARAELTGYSDRAKVSSFAREAMEWAVATGILQGMTSTTLAPGGQSTRAQLAAMLTRFMTWVNT